MAKFNIKFNNTDYQIDESALANATNDLKQHLSTTMTGTGAIIELGGTTYNIDPTKLSTATTDFVAHLNTISGSGFKVVVNGVEYGADSNKLSGAVSELANHFDTLKTEVAESLPAGLYATGAIALNEAGETDAAAALLKTSWEDLLANGTIHVENGVVYTDFDSNEWVNPESETLAGDLVLPADDSITEIGNAMWDDSIYNEESDDYGDYVGNFGFACCESLTGIKIPSSVTTISESAFDCCILLKELTIPEGVTTIGEYAFTGCVSLESVEIPASVMSIGESAFDNCTSLTNVTLGENSQLVTISDAVFINCYSLASLKIPESVETIGEFAFSRTSLTSVEIPASVMSIGGWAFYYCESLESVTFSENSQLATIGQAAFHNCTSLTNIEIPASVETIDRLAFSDCTNLTSMEIPDSITRIGEYAFQHCTNLEYNEYDNGYYLGTTTNPYFVFITLKNDDIISCEINANTKIILDGAFKGRESLVSVTFEDGSQLTTIPYYAFHFCPSLTSIEIPASVTNIDDFAFGSCTSLESIIFAGTVEQWNMISKVGHWNYNVPATYIQCSDGQVTL